MELNREQIIKALECCEGGGKPCLSCPYFYKAVDTSCAPFLIKDALALINELTEENKSLKQCIEHEHRSFMETFGELDDKCKSLYEENERLRAENKIEYETPLGKQTMPNLSHLEGDAARLYTQIENKIKADTVRKMQERLGKHFCHDPAFLGVEQRLIMDVIDQIAKEMLENADDK